jgi:hypothetical protein
MHTIRPVIYFLLATLYTGTDTHILLFARDERAMNSDACVGNGVPNAVPECRHQFVR